MLTNASFIVHARIERVKIMEIDVKFKLGSIIIDYITYIINGIMYISKMNIFSFRYKIIQS